jgi:hypothetical protein
MDEEQRVAINDKTLFVDMQKAIQTFFNNARWTEDDFKIDEQINCNILITIKESPAQNQFAAVVQLTASRPLYGTNFETPLITFIDQDLKFRYVQGQPMIFAKNNFTDNLTATLAFYAYLILAMDYDSFAKGGGKQYMEEAFNIANIANSSNQGDPGWVNAQGRNNRFRLVDNMMNQQFLPFREAIYSYHRLGLDTFTQDAPKAREIILEVLKTIDDVNKLRPAAYYTNIFFDTKGAELINIFKPAPQEMRQKAHEYLTRLDPNKAAMYNVLIQ